MMKGRMAAIGLSALCVLLVSAVAVHSASAAGTTAYTCASGGGNKEFSEAHCNTNVGNGNGSFGHVAIEAGKTTEIVISDKNLAGEHTGAILKSKIAGAEIELVASEVSGTGTLANSEVGGEMFATGEGKITYSGVTEKLLGCKVTGKPGGAGVVETKQLHWSTAGIGDRVRFKPAGENTLWAEFELTECIVGPISVKVLGNVLGAASGATVTFVHNTVTSEKNLRLQSPTGNLAGLAGVLTLSGRTGGGGAYTPLSFTT